MRREFPSAVKLTHYSDEHVTNVRYMDRQIAEAAPKPRGFWVSVDGEAGGNQGWADFCHSEDWNIAGLRFVHDVKLRAGANVLVLSSASDLDEFTEGYGTSYPYPGTYASTYILWHRVAALYSGIIITPYIWARRLEGKASGWYHGWDCASGCIWDAGAVESITLRQNAEAA